MKNEVSGTFIWNIDHMVSLVGKAESMFKESLQQDDFSNFQERYYLARDMLRRSESYYDRALESIRAMGKLPPEILLRLSSSTREVIQRATTNDKDVAPGTILPHVLSELETDPVLLRWMSPEEIRSMVHKHLPAQLQGKRKIANLKLRIAFEKVHRSLVGTKKLGQQSRLRYLQLRNNDAIERGLPSS